MTVAQPISLNLQSSTGFRTPSGRRLEVLAFVAFAITVTAFFLGDIATLPMRMWDESRLAVNAAEMAITGQHLVTTYGFAPDLWNTKPPLLINIMAWSIELFGFNTFALRLPSALAGIGTVLITVQFVRWATGSLSWGVVAGVLLGTSTAFYGEHAAQTGDYDALLTLFTTAYAMLLLALFAETWPKADRRRPWVVVGTGILIGLAILTKGVAGVIPGVGCATYAIVFARRQLFRGVLDFTVIILIAVLIGGGFYLVRSLGDPAYLSAVAVNDLGGRFNTVQDKHYGTALVYLRPLIKARWNRFWPDFAGSASLILGVAAPWLSQGRARHAAIFAICQAAAIVAVYSIAATKLPWYTIPAYPYLAILVALAGAGIVDRQRGHRQDSAPTYALIAIGLSLVIGQAAIGRYLRPIQPETTPRAFDRLFTAAAASNAWPLAVVDHGFPNEAGYKTYTPTLRFYILAAEREGHPAKQIAGMPAAGAVMSRAIGSCDPTLVNAVAALMPPVWRGYGCVLVTRPSAAEVKR